MSARKRSKRQESRPRQEAALAKSDTLRAGGGWLAALGWWPFAIGLVACLALMLRLEHAASIDESPFGSVLVGDGRAYDQWAADIAAGHWLGTTVFYQAPLYPYVVACVYAVAGHSVAALRVVQAVLGTASCVMLGFAGRRFFGPREGVLTACLLAIYPAAIFFDGIVQKSSLDLFLLSALLACLGAWLHSPRSRWLAGAGFALGLFALNRENARVLYPVIAGWLLVHDRALAPGARAIRAAVFSAAVAVVVLPVGVRNYSVGGEFLLSTSQAGPNFYIGNHAGATGLYEPLVPDRGDAIYEREDATRLAIEASGRQLSPSEVSDYWVARTFADIGRDPLAWAAGLGRKSLLVLNAWEPSDNESIEAYAEYSGVLRWLGWFTFGVAFPVAVLGAWLTRGAWRRHGILLGMAAALGASVALFYVFARYRFPLIPTVLLYAGATAPAAFASIRAWRREWVPGLALAVAATVIACLPLKIGADATAFSVGSEMVRLGRAAEALPLLEKAVREAPGHAPSWLGLGTAQLKTGQHEAAMTSLTTALRLRPDDAEAHGMLGVALQALNRQDQALGHFAAAVRLRPDDAEAHWNLGLALAAAGRNGEAKAEYEAVLRLNPNHAHAHSNLGGLFQQEGRIGDALEHLQTAVRLNPTVAEMHLNLGVLLANTRGADAAIPEFDAAVRLAPDLPDAAYLSGVAHARSGRCPEAIPQLEQARALAQTSGRADLGPAINAALASCRSDPGQVLR